MWGAIVGDIAGSIYEFDQFKKTKPISCENLMPEEGFYSDDTILTVAVAYSILKGIDFEDSLKDFGKRYQNYKPNVKNYFEGVFSPGFTKWLNGSFQGSSTGNGAMMRVSPVGFLAKSEEEVLKLSEKATIPSHNSREAVESAQIVALIIFYAKNGFSKQKIIDKMNLKIEYKPFKNFNCTCADTIGNCLYALFSSNSFDESVKKVISFGGDTDTNACIVGAMAEAMYGIKKEYVDFVKTKIPEEFCDIMEKVYDYNKNNLNKEFL